MDVTYVRCWTGFVYLAFIVDVFAQNRVHPHHRVPRRAHRTIADVEYATAGWVDWYNNRRLHGSLDYLTPVEFEAAHYATLNREPQPV